MVIEEQIGYNEYFNKRIVKNQKDIVYWKMTIIEGDNVEQEVIVKYANNKWLYKKAISIL